MRTSKDVDGIVILVWKLQRMVIWIVSNMLAEKVVHTIRMTPMKALFHLTNGMNSFDIEQGNKGNLL